MLKFSLWNNHKITVFPSIKYGADDTKGMKEPKCIEVTRWPDSIDFLTEEMEKANIILVTHHHKDHCK